MKESKPIVKVLATTPKNAEETFQKVRELIKKGWIEIPHEQKYNGTAAPGDYLEFLLGGKKNNKDSPDIEDWEVKFHGGTALITLFHKEPQPRGVIKHLVNKYGKLDDQGRISFRHTFASKSPLGFYVVAEDDRILIRNSEIDDVVPYWKLDTLLNHIGGKLRRLIVVEGQYQKTTKQVKYEKATALWDFKISGFSKAVVDGKIQIDFDARTQIDRSKAIRNHGTKFRIHIRDIVSIYEHQVKL